MYTAHKNVQILIALLKEHGVKHIVCSAGTRNISFVFSVLRDDYFKCYSVVDERSAAFFALGIIQSIQEPVAIVCTSGTAACNYLSAVTEAYYQHLPLVVLTSDRLHAHLNQQEDQCIPQVDLYKNVVRKGVDLPVVRDDMDAWFCGRLVNEALLELNHREKGPVHINFQTDPKYPYDGGDFIIDQDKLPRVTKITRIMADDDITIWKNLSDYMMKKKILLLYGQNEPLSDVETEQIDKFCDKYDVVVFSDILSNLHVKNYVGSAGVLTQVVWEDIRPDIVITMGGNRIADPKYGIRKIKDSIEHWHVSSNGEIADIFMCQNRIIECKQSFFFQRLAEFGEVSEQPYLEEWRKYVALKIKRHPSSEDFKFSQVYALKKLFENIPQNGVLHISNSNCIRIASAFDFPKNVEIYCNRGTCGIDGSMSSYVAQSYITKKPSFLCIGDLSFFYDMNALWNKYINGNTRILLCNNSGGAILNWGSYLTVNVEGAPVNTGATHETTARGWVESRGFKYLCARTKDEYDIAIKEFTKVESETPMLLEVFSDMSVDIKERGRIALFYMDGSTQNIQALKSAIPTPVKNVLKSILKK